MSERGVANWPKSLKVGLSKGGGLVLGILSLHHAHCVLFFIFITFNILLFNSNSFK